MNASQSLRIAAFVVLTPGTVLSAAENSPARESLPRYKLEVGQQLVYEGLWQYASTNEKYGTTDHTTYWVTRTNKDGSWHIVGRNENQFFNGDAAHQDTAGNPPRVAFDAFELFPDGRVTEKFDDVQSSDLLDLFVSFPANLAPAKSGGTVGWTVERSPESKTAYQLGPEGDPDSGRWVFEKMDRGIFSEVYPSNSRNLLYFDARRGLIIRTESQSRYEEKGGTGRGVTELKSATMKDHAWVAELGQEAEVFLQARTAMRNAERSLRDGVSVDDAVAAVRQALSTGRAQVKLPEVQKEFDALRSRLDSSAKYLAESQQEEAEVINKPAADWETTDLDGNKRSLADYRGKVVVLDFWYRGCGWCIRAMPQIKEVADHFRDQPVAVLGMNIDKREKDARFVIDKLQLNYPTLKAEGIPDKYWVHGFPTLVIIDQKGIVRARHVGYTQNLREEVTKTIDGLLAKGG
jgi:thiol-disulfide isomerase/thioredoxin